MNEVPDDIITLVNEFEMCLPLFKSSFSNAVSVGFIEGRKNSINFGVQNSKKDRIQTRNCDDGDLLDIGFPSSLIAAVHNAGAGVVLHLDPSYELQGIKLNYFTRVYSNYTFEEKNFIHLDGIYSKYDNLEFPTFDTSSFVDAKKGSQRRLTEEEKILLTYTSSAVEGITLSIGETRSVIMGERVEKSESDILETKNLYTAINVLEDLIEENTLITRKLVQRLNKVIQNGIIAEAGFYRGSDVWFRGMTFEPPSHFSLNFYMKKFEELAYKVKDKDPLEVGILLHYVFVSIHPFMNGNGRVARLLLNYPLIANGQDPIVIDPKKRTEYIDSLKADQFNLVNEEGLLGIKKWEYSSFRSFILGVA